MRFRRLFAVALAMLVVTGCAPDTTAPLGSPGDGDGASGFPAAVGSVSDLRSDLERLAIRTVPNPSAFLSKFDALVAAIPGDDFGGELLNLLNFLEHQVQVRYLQPPRRGNLTDCVTPPNGVPNCETVGMLYDEVVAGIMAMVGLSSGPDTTICILPDGHTSEFCRAPKEDDQGTGFVFFPATLFDKLTFVSVKSLGDEASVNSGLDEHGFTVEIRTAPVTQFGAVRPTVVACVAPGLDQATLDRLLLGHRRAGLNAPFSLLPAADAVIEAEAIDYCGAANGGPPSVFGLSPDSPLNRLLVSARDLFLPAQLSASNAVILARGFSGASGSPEEFSTFRAVDRGVTGAGGSPEEFAPQATGGDPVPDVTGEIGSEANDVYVLTVETPGSGLGVNGVKVTFTLADPISGLPSSEATFCDGSSTVIVYTGGLDGDAPMGSARIPCLRFGLEAGYKNLSAEIDPTSVDDLACVVNPLNGACLPGTDTGNYLVWSKSEPAPDWGASGYSYLLTSEGGGPTNFHLPSFDDSAWLPGSAPFGGGPSQYANCTLYNTTAPPATVWPIGNTTSGGASDLLVRKQFSMSAAGQVSIQVAIDNDVQVFLNGAEVSGSGLKKHEGCATRPGIPDPFTFYGSVQAGENVIAIRARDRGVISYLDIRVAPYVVILDD